MRASNAQVISAARLWLGTPYRHQASVRGVGCDCLGLIRGVWRALLGPEPVVPPAYPNTWRRRGAQPLLEEAAVRYLIAWSGSPQGGTVLLFRIGNARAAQHCGILVSPDHFIHAREHLGVIISPLDATWKRRLTSSYAYPSSPVCSRSKEGKT